MRTKRFERSTGTGHLDFNKAIRGKNPDESSDDRANRIAREVEARNELIERQNEERQAKIQENRARREERKEEGHL